MDAHACEAAVAIAATQATYGVAGGVWDGHRRRWQEDDYVMFYYEGNLCRGHVMAVEEGVERDTYRIRRHVTGGGSEVVEVMDRALLPY